MSPLKEWHDTTSKGACKWPPVRVPGRGIYLAAIGREEHGRPQLGHSAAAKPGHTSDTRTDPPSSSPETREKPCLVCVEALKPARLSMPPATRR
jgi:hypothetical protein